MCIRDRLIRLPIPDLSEERRVEMKKIVKSMGEKCKVSIRNIRREGNDDSYANGVGVDQSNGDVYVVGVWEGTSNDWFQVDDEQKFRGHCGNYMESSFIVRFENDGTHRWSKEIEGYRAQGELYCDNNYRNELKQIKKSKKRQADAINKLYPNSKDSSN